MCGPRRLHTRGARLHAGRAVQPHHVPYYGHCTVLLRHLTSFHAAAQKDTLQQRPRQNLRILPDQQASATRRASQADRTTSTMPMSENRSRAVRGELYHAFTPELVRARKRARIACERFNAATDATRREKIQLWQEYVGTSLDIFVAARELHLPAPRLIHPSQHCLRQASHSPSRPQCDRGRRRSCAPILSLDRSAYSSRLRVQYRAGRQCLHKFQQHILGHVQGVYRRKDAGRCECELLRR